MEPPLIIYKSGPLHYLRWLVFTHSTVDYSYHRKFIRGPAYCGKTPYFEAFNSYRSSRLGSPTYFCLSFALHSFHLSGLFVLI